MKFLKKLIWILKNIEYTEDSMTIGCKINLCQDVNMNYRRITNLSNPFDGSDAASRFYVSGVQSNVVFVAKYGVSSFSEVSEQHRMNGIVLVEMSNDEPPSSMIYHLSRVDYNEELGAACKYYFTNGPESISIDWAGAWKIENP